VCLRDYSESITIFGLLKTFRYEFNYYLYLLDQEGFEVVSKEYYHNWMHTNYLLDVFGPRGQRRRAQVVGISPSGNLQVLFLSYFLGKIS